MNFLVSSDTCNTEDGCWPANAKQPLLLLLPTHCSTAPSLSSVAAGCPSSQSKTSFDRTDPNRRQGTVAWLLLLRRLLHSTIEACKKTENEHGQT
ncbi:hypothetical protein OUZ56_021381 [Daphnia magna]|uniref:Uncharacterized protein n=1 Tax=Daphnia magna TaxID=35525 RepID=A0ABQ9ZI90_9CRUS|nr:hypothetical protein OUZ56_021381 [Daphnia magna]